MMMSKERDFDTDIKINKYQLEIECEQHASTYLYWARKLADAKSDLNSADDTLKLVSAQTDLEVRNTWDDRNGKQTENSIKAVVESHENIITAKADYNKIQREVNTLSAVVTAMEHRRDMLKCEKELLIGGFYSAPNGGKREGATEAVQREVRGKLNKHKKEEE
jgi:hypothetical protein